MTRLSWVQPAPLSAAVPRPHGFRSPFLVPVARRLGKGGLDGRRLGHGKPGIERIVDRSVSRLYPAILLLHDADGSGNGDDRSQTVERCRGSRGRQAAGHQFVRSRVGRRARPHRRMALRAMLRWSAVSAEC
jgi:hypothetical protein